MTHGEMLEVANVERNRVSRREQTRLQVNDSQFGKNIDVERGRSDNNAEHQ